MPVSTILTGFLAGLGEAVNAPLGLAVSGGGDSLAMLHLAVQAGLRVQAVTVDHGLRSESASEAAMVAQVCNGLGVPHATLRWQGWDHKGNLQDHARNARRRLIAEWAHRAGLGAVALAHTQDDLAETFLMRLARGAGVDGLSAMSARWTEGGVIWLRPLLAASRQSLRDMLRAEGVAWVDDPSNEMDRFDRVKARKALVALAPLGLTPPTLAAVARHLAEARTALEAATDTAAATLLQPDGAAICIAEGWRDLPEEISRRLLVCVIQTIAPAPYAPRGPALMRLGDALSQRRPAALAGCRFLFAKTGLRAVREANAVAGLQVPVGQAWDGWHMIGPATDGMTVRALGAEGLAQCADWRTTLRPRAELLASPSVWLDDRLIAAPMAQIGTEWRAMRVLPPHSASLSALSH